MTLSKKTKSELILEVKKLQRKLDLSQKTQAPKKSKNIPTLTDSKWDSFFKNSPNIIVIINRKGIILDINKVSKTNKKENIVGKSAYSFVAKDAVKTMKTAIDKVFKTKKSQEYNSWRIDEKGVSHFYKSKVTALLEKKNVTAAVIDAIEISNEIDSHIQLKESEQKFRMLAENATDLIYRCRVFPDFKYEYISPSVKTITGYSAEDFYSQPFLGFKIVHPDDIHLLGDSENLIKKKSKISNVKGLEVVVRWIKKDGSVIWTETRNKPVFDKKKAANCN